MFFYNLCVNLFYLNYVLMENLKVVTQLTGHVLYNWYVQSTRRIRRSLRLAVSQYQPTRRVQNGAMNSNTNHDEPFGSNSRHFRQFDPQARIEEFQKRIDQLKSNFPTARHHSHRPMFEPGTFAATSGGPTHPLWSQRNTTTNENVSNGHVPMEKTIPIHVQHERTPSREESQRQQSASPSNGNNMNEPGPRFASFHDPSFFHQKFHDAFHHPTGGAESGGNEAGESPRVHHIPIQLESRPGVPVVPKPTTPATTNSPSPQPPQPGASQPASRPSQPHPPHPPASHAHRANVFEVPIQISKSSSATETNPTASNTATNAAASSDKSTVTLNQAHPNQVNESASDPNIANPKIVYAMGYEPLNKSAESKANGNQEGGAKQETPFDYVSEVLDDLKNYESQVNEFNGTSSEDKGYRFLDEMLTLCVLRLDCINIDGNDELRKYRKSAINQVNRVIGMLEAKVSRKQQHQPDQPMETDTAAKEDIAPANAEPHQAQGQSSSEVADHQAPSGGNAIPLPMSPQPTETDVASKEDGKKSKKGKDKEKDKSPKEKKESKRIIFFRKKSSNKEANSNNNKDLDTNNNDLKKEDGSSGGAGSSSDQASETASNCSDSTVTLRTGCETEV